MHINLSSVKNLPLLTPASSNAVGTNSSLAPPDAPDGYDDASV